MDNHTINELRNHGIWITSIHKHTAPKFGPTEFDIKIKSENDLGLIDLQEALEIGIDYLLKTKNVNG